MEKYPPEEFSLNCAQKKNRSILLLLFQFPLRHKPYISLSMCDTTLILLVHQFPVHKSFFHFYILNLIWGDIENIFG
ncbi:MAG: hypothetical protein PWQ97_1759 [Tepidanaerobacteraceae bacterium]|nr:hypothetical protein [Tepidanaerobacteraceae bacterium]